MRQFKWLEALIKKAKADWNVKAERKVMGDVVFSLEIDEDGRLQAFRQGTRILDANVHTKEIKSIGGAYSRSDSQYINQIIWEFGMFHPQLRYTHTRGFEENGVTLVNHYPKMIASINDTLLRDLHTHIEILVGQVFGQKVSSLYNYDAKQYEINTMDGKHIYTLEYGAGFKFVNHIGKEDTYENYFTGEKLAQISMKYYYTTVLELIRNDYFDIHHKQIVQ